MNELQNIYCNDVTKSSSLIKTNVIIRERPCSLHRLLPLAQILYCHVGQSYKPFVIVELELGSSGTEASCLLILGDILMADVYPHKNLDKNTDILLDFFARSVELDFQMLSSTAEIIHNHRFQLMNNF